LNLEGIETKLVAARTRLILDKPFLGALVLRLPVVAAKPEWCPTTATDARNFYYNPRYIAGLSMPETQFILAHEALHCALSHFARRQHRIKLRWDQACDLAVNPLLVDDGLQPPPNALIVDEFKGMTAEEIYPCLDDSFQDQPLDRHAYEDDRQTKGPGQADKGNPCDERTRENQHGKAQDEPQKGGPDQDTGHAPLPPPLSAGERETLNIQWQQRMAGAAQQALQAGKLGGALARMIDHLLQPQLPWRMLLARYMTAVSRDDFSYMRPSRREGNFILPSLRSTQIDVVVALDTSGSIKIRELDEFLAEIDAIKGQMRARITLLPCDARIAAGAPWVFESWEEFKLPASVEGGGGTDFQPVFDWVGQQGMQPELLVYFTDAEGTFPAREPEFPVLWLIKGKNRVPWGQRIQLN
jgi:predicted metal-dependent peptidase